MSPEDKQLLERWLMLIDRLRDRGTVTTDDVAVLRRDALEAVLT